MGLKIFGIGGEGKLTGADSKAVSARQMAIRRLPNVLNREFSVSLNARSETLFGSLKVARPNDQRLKTRREANDQTID